MTRRRTLRQLGPDTSGLALIEFAYTLPILLMLSLGGAELTNFITVKMRLSQIALQIADNAARMGTGTATQAKMVSETDINDLFAGAQLSSGGLDLRTNGRVILSDLEEKNSAAPKYRVVWQRCYGLKTGYTSSYGAVNANVNGMGETGRLVTAQSSTPTMFVEVRYDYQPIVGVEFIKALGMTRSTSFKEIASMSVRDRRDMTQVYNTAGATVSSC